MSKGKVLIAMSGGVDSSVAAYLLTRDGYDCVGCTMKLCPDDVSHEGGCCTADDADDARSVARRIGIPFYVFNMTDLFKANVIDRFVACYRAGRTPNPCIDCNRTMKFAELRRRGEELGYDLLATGRYAKIEEKDGRYRLKKAADPSKDQSYVLYHLTQEELKRTLFPLGHLTKEETRALAAESGFLNADKPDSQDICFVPDGDYAAVIARYTDKTEPEGDFILPDGTVVGRHKGISRCTVGQRRGLGVAYSEPLYVKRILVPENKVLLARNEDLYERACTVRDVNWISGETPGEPIKCAVKIRYRQTEQPATVTPLSDGRAKVVFDAPQRAITPGQSAVFYDGDAVLGGGVIES
ncbi:MAG: tRNA 2-thiouridine(34) synthase MnmA, partial [Clostridia bacterium]|nr:tRNA 2-thiouridine(34) synthase MnmA [Clostridia bacterium]